MIFKVSPVATNYLWCGVAGASAGGLQLLTFLVEVSQAEVDELEVEIRVNQNVARLDVSMGASYGVQVLDSADQLLEELAGFLLRELVLGLDIGAQLSLLCVLHHKEEVLVGFDDFVQFDDVGMVHLAQNRYFPPDPH